MKSKNSKNKPVLVIAALAIIILALAAYSYLSEIGLHSLPSPVRTTGNILYPFSGDAATAQMNLPAINANDTGVGAILTVTAKKGTGKIYFNVNNALANTDTQQSARTAAFYAANRENISLATVDITYDIRAAASLIEGPSAGAAFAIATIAALENKPVSSDAMITGAINHDGTIGPSGKILEKAIVSKTQGAKVFLAPVGSLASIDLNYTEQEFCHNWGGYEYCQPEFVPQILNATDEAGIPIVEVATVDDALPYFIKASG